MKKHLTTPLSRFFSIVAIFAIIASQLIPAGVVGATQIGTRLLTLKANGTSGGSLVGGVANHRFTFTLPTTGTLGSIKFQYCTLAAGACVTPDGLDTTTATLGLEDPTVYGFSLITTDNGTPYLTRTAVSGGGNVTYELDGVTNPTTLTNPPTVPNQTFFVRISTYTGTDGVTGPVDSGTVAASTNEAIVLDGTMPESLVFCTGHTIGLLGGVPDCSSADSGAISFDQLFSPTDTASATSQMAASTNAGAGYAISVHGTTLTSGSNTVTNMSSPVAGTHGLSQFGMNLKANTVATTTVAKGIEVAPAVGALGGLYKGQALTGYDGADVFKYVDGNDVAASSAGGAGGSDAQIFTATYIVNVPGSQPAGTYTTTLTYICTPTF